jgi:hypothetical protein
MYPPYPNINPQNTAHPHLNGKRKSRRSLLIEAKICLKGVKPLPHKDAKIGLVAIIVLIQVIK